ncbi:MAG: 30S ribosome-binding factor RbfA [Actinobacteria bacterium]|jgi:ribosome-binding factor A|nr:MAG: 30S ribosome-binding factor RbfA [Actinomycetota bacterium]
MTHAARRYDRTARVNEVVREVLADELERLADPQLGLLTVTGVEVSPDLRQATVYYSALIPSEGEAEHDIAGALSAARPHLQAAIGRQVRMKYTPQLVFREDPAIRTGERVDEILRQLHSEGE